jgi:hypothetical protein
MDDTVFALYQDFLHGWELTWCGGRLMWYKPYNESVNVIGCYGSALLHKYNMVPRP